MTWDVTTGPGVTALGLAAARSVESSREDRLIEDPLAPALFRAAGAELPMRTEWPAPGSEVSATERLHLHGSRYIGLRTRFYDDEVQAAAAGGVRQAVLLGAGLDTRALRLDLPTDLVLFELDQAGVLDYKQAVLDAEPRCRHVLVGVDLRDDWPAALAANDHDPARPTAWIAEGLLAYLPPEAQATLLARIDERSAPGSTLALDRIVGDPAQGGRLEDLAERSGIRMDQLIAGGEGEDLGTLLGARGWTVEEREVSRVAERYGRDLGDPFGAAGAAPSAEPPWLDTVFLTARR